MTRVIPLTIWLFSSLLPHCTVLGVDERHILEFQVTPAAIGRQLVRTALPFPVGKLREGESVVAVHEQQRTPVAVRPLGWHGVEADPPWVRQALVTFPHEFTELTPADFKLSGRGDIPDQDSRAKRRCCAELRRKLDHQLLERPHLPCGSALAGL